MTISELQVIPESPVLSKMPTTKEVDPQKLQTPEKVESKDETVLDKSQKSIEKQELELMLSDKSNIYCKRDKLY